MPEATVTTSLSDGNPSESQSGLYESDDDYDDSSDERLDDPGRLGEVPTPYPPDDEDEYDAMRECRRHDPLDCAGVDPADDEDDGGSDDDNGADDAEPAGGPPEVTELRGAVAKRWNQTIKTPKRALSLARATCPRKPGTLGPSERTPRGCSRTSSAGGAVWLAT